MPKQFAPLFDGQSLFRKTVVTNAAVCESQFIVSNADQFFLAKDQLEAEGQTGSKFLLEPVGRNTAPAIALACLTMNPETIVLVSPSDHVIRKKEEYKKVLLRAQELAEAGNLVTFGITPTSPAPFLRSKCPLSSPKSGAERGLLCPEKLPIQHSGIHFLSE